MIKSSFIPYVNANEYFKAQRIICIGRNFPAHAKEMGHDPSDHAPFFFFKPLTSLLHNPSRLTLPSWSQNIEHEVELVVALTQGGQELCGDSASELVGGLGVGLDLTARDKQQEAKNLSRPWDLSKGFDGAAPVSSLYMASACHIDELGEIELQNSGITVQSGRIDDMIDDVSTLIANLSRFIALHQGDLIFTGTPKGVARIQKGDVITARIEHLEPTLSFEVV